MNNGVSCRSCRKFSSCRIIADDSFRKVSENMEYMASVCQMYEKQLRLDDIYTPWDGLTKEQWCAKTAQQFRIS